MSKKNFLQAMHGWQEKTIRREFDFVCVPCMEASLPLPTSGPYYANSPRGVMRNVWKKRLAFVSGNERGRRRSSSSDQVTMRVSSWDEEGDLYCTCGWGSRSICFNLPYK